MPVDRRLQHFVDFNGLVLPRGHLELSRRRISPIALIDSAHHRQSWLMTVLPFCPETLELLVDTCPLCGFTLGWVNAVGIGRCENCLKTIPPSALPSLPEDLAENYRLFAGLLSLRPSERAGSVASMPPRLRQLTPGELARLAMRCGLDCVDSGGKRAWQTRAGRLPPERIAHTVAQGISLLRSWPHGIAAWAEDQLARATDENACRRDLKRRISRIAWGDSRFSNQRSLLGEIFPKLEAPSKRSTVDSAFYTGRKAKPWSEIYEALISQQIAFWLEGGIDTKRLFVARGSLNDFLTTNPRVTKNAAPDMASRDAAELLNLSPGDVLKLRSANLLSQTKGPRAMMIPRMEVERMAAEYVSASEISRRARTTAECANNRLRALGFESFHGLWKRSEVLEALPLRYC